MPPACLHVPLPLTSLQTAEPLSLPLPAQTRADGKDRDGISIRETYRELFKTQSPGKLPLLRIARWWLTETRAHF